MSDEVNSIDGITGKPRQQYTTEFLTVPAEGIAVTANCADITFTNYGTEPLIVNDVVNLAQNTSISVQANRGEIDRTKYRIRYGSGAGTKNAIIVRRIYK